VRQPLGALVEIGRLKKLKKLNVWGLKVSDFKKVTLLIIQRMENLFTSS